MVLWLLSAIRDSVRPANIGKGVFSKQIAQELATVSTVGSKFSKAISALAYGAVAIDVGLGVYGNAISNASADKVLHDALTDILITGGTIYTSIEVGALIGSVVPVAGTAIGAASGMIIGIGIYIITDMTDFADGQTIREYLKSAVG